MDKVYHQHEERVASVSQSVVAVQFLHLCGGCVIKTSDLKKQGCAGRLGRVRRGRGQGGGGVPAPSWISAMTVAT